MSVADDVTRAAAAPQVCFDAHPDSYRHWRLSVDGAVATLVLDVDEQGGLLPAYELKLNSYDLGVDIELYDAVQRLRFEHPQVRCVVLTGGKEKVFSAGANIRMLAQSTHQAKVNFCKFTNETRLGIEDACAHSGQTWIAALNGTASGGGYELALACAHIMLVDDGSSAVSLPEVPLLAVLPGTGGLTRVVDKRRVRRDLADVFATRAEGVRGRTAVEWRLVDEVVSRSRFDATVQERAAEFVAAAGAPRATSGVTLTPLPRELADDGIRYRYVQAELDETTGVARITVSAPGDEEAVEVADIHARGAEWWPLAMTRELDDLILHLRTNRPTLGTWVLRTEGDPAAVMRIERALLQHADDWLVKEVRHYLKRTLKRLDVTSRSLIALVEPQSCFAGPLLELALAADRVYMLDDPTQPTALLLGESNFGSFPMGNGLSRLETRFLGDETHIQALRTRVGDPLDAATALQLGLVTFAPDDIDWDDEVRLAVEERAGYSPDALTGLEANCRFPGPETMETKIFARLTAWQNWIFSRPNAAGEAGALRRYGTGRRADFDRTRV